MDSVDTDVLDLPGIKERAEAGRMHPAEPPERPKPTPRIPKRFTGKTLGSYRPKTDSQRVALRTVRRWVEAVAGGEGPMLALIGPQGTGKSHLLYGAAAALAEARVATYCRPWYLLSDWLRYGQTVENERGSTEREPQEVRGRMLASAVVLIDEVRPTSGTEFDDTELAKFACHAYDDEVPVLVTTNTNPLAKIMGAPAASRFTSLVIEGPNGREIARV